MGAHRPRGSAQEGRRIARLSSRVVRVHPDVPAIHRAFLYHLPATSPDVDVGTIVRVPLHGRRVRGWVVEIDPVVPSDLDQRDIHAVTKVVSAGPPADVVDLCRWAAWRWAGPVATFLRAASPANLIASLVAPDPETAIYPETALHPGGALTGRRLELVPPRGELQVPLASEGSTLVVDPSPVRAATLARRWEQEGREVVRLGADQPDVVRTEQWARARAGACVVIGGRAAVWAPVPDLAGVVVLDEGDESLEDERAPTWNARDVAFERAARAGAALRVLTPAPTIDALVAVDQHDQPDQPEVAEAGAPVRWPPLEVVDQRDQEPGLGLLSAPLADALRAIVARRARAVCVLNRRGRARLLACRTCGALARCEACGAAVIQSDDVFGCGQCSATRPPVCLECHGATFRAVRPGITRVRDDLAALLPRTDVVSVDASTDVVPDVPVLVGTEAVLHRLTAGAGSPVGLVAYLELDQELLAPRARAAEQALWLLVRGARVLDGSGRLLVQTRVPEHEVIDAVRHSDPMRAIAVERDRRRALGFPPFGGLAEVSGAPEAVAALGAAVADRVTVLGPVADGRRESVRALLRAPSVAQLCDALALPEVDAARAKGRLRIDVDPRRI